MIAIRTDANKVIASGHIMRCMTIAEEIEKREEAVLFITADHNGDELLDNYGYEHVALNTDYTQMMEEIPKLRELARQRGIDKVIVDSYSVTEEYIRELKGFLKVTVIEDELRNPYDADIIINYNAYVDADAYGIAYNARNTRKLLGLKYAPLRRQFRYVHETEERNQNVLNILITTGGADKVGAAKRIVKELVYAGLMNKKLPAGTLSLHIIQGALADYSEIEAVSEIYDNIVVYHNVDNMAELMKKADLAICTCGMIITECAAVRLPAIFFSLAKNQIPNAMFWKDYQIYAGDASEDVEKTMVNMVESLKTLIQDIDKIDEIKNTLKQFEIGSGAAMIASEIINL